MNRLNENKGQADGAIMQLSYFDNNGELEIKKKNNNKPDIFHRNSIQ